MSGASNRGAGEGVPTPRLLAVIFDANQSTGRFFPVLEPHQHPASSDLHGCRYMPFARLGGADHFWKTFNRKY